MAPEADPEPPVPEAEAVVATSEPVEEEVADKEAEAAISEIAEDHELVRFTLCYARQPVLDLEAKQRRITDDYLDDSLIRKIEAVIGDYGGAGRADVAWIWLKQDELAVGTDCGNPVVRINNAIQ